MMLRYTERSREDVKLAFIWYEKQQEGLGGEFLRCIEEALQRIVAFPEMYQVRYAAFRSSPIRRFPFSLFYTIEGSEIIVHAVFNNRLDPQKKP